MAEFAYSNAEALSAKYAVMAKTTPSKINQFARETGDYIVDSARVLAPKRTGRLARSITRSGAIRSGDTSTVNIKWGISAARYGRFVEYGTGLHIDPRLGSPHLIYPRTAKVMRWTERGPFATAYQGAGVFSKQIRGGKDPRFAIFAKYTKGQRGVHFMELAFESADRVFVPARLKLLGEEIIH